MNNEASPNPDPAVTQPQDGTAATPTNWLVHSRISAWSGAVRHAGAPLPYPALPDSEVIAERDRGGMGVVYQARDLTQTRPGAFKVALADSFALIAAASLIGLTWLYRDANVQRRHAEEEQAAARKAAEEAKQACARVSAVNRFLIHDVLSQGMPEMAQNPKITFEEVLLQAAKRIDVTLKDQPEAEAEVRTVIGKTLTQLARNDEAVPHLKRALALREQLHGNTAAVTRAARASLTKAAGELTGRAQPVARSEEEHRRKADRLRQELGPNAEETIAAENALANVLAESKPEEAERLYLALTERAQTSLGANSAAALSIASNYGFFLYRKNRFLEAERTLRQAWQGMKQYLGETHPATVACGNYLALAFQSQNKHSEAEALFRSTLKARQHALGDEHPDTQHALQNLASELANNLAFAEAEPLMGQCVAYRRKALGGDHPDTLEALMKQAYFCARLARHADAEPLYQECWEGRRRKLGAQNPDTLFVLHELAFSQSAQGKLGSAAANLRLCWEGRTQALGADHPLTLNTQLNLGAALGSANQFTASEETLLEAQRGILALAKPAPDLADRAKLLLEQVRAKRERAERAKGNAEAKPTGPTP